MAGLTPGCARPEPIRDGARRAVRGTIPLHTAGSTGPPLPRSPGLIPAGRGPWRGVFERPWECRRGCGGGTRFGCDPNRRVRGSRARPPSTNRTLSRTSSVPASRDPPVSLDSRTSGLSPRVPATRPVRSGASIAAGLSNASNSRSSARRLRAAARRAPDARRRGAVRSRSPGSVPLSGHRVGPIRIQREHEGPRMIRKLVCRRRGPGSAVLVGQVETACHGCEDLVDRAPGLRADPVPGPLGRPDRGEQPRHRDLPVTQRLPERLIPRSADSPAECRTSRPTTSAARTYRHAVPVSARSTRRSGHPAIRRHPPAARRGRA